MDDLIRRQAAIDEAKEWIDAVYFEENDKRERKAIECFIGSLKNMPSAQQWIPCSERLPELDNSYSNSKEYLVQWDNGRIDITRYSNVNIFWQNETTEPYWKGEQYSKVVAWMPLPEPYKGGEKS